MDKYNIIVPTNDINELTNDMCNWYNMPFNMRMRSNDDCNRIYGCDVTTLFNSIKKKILAGEDLMNADKDNLVVRESFNDIENLDYNIALSKKLQESPYIVIIDPYISNTEELNTRYNSFNSLNSKYKRLSNDYSYQLYGYNVYDMYLKISDKLSAIVPEESNIRSVNENIDFISNDKYNFINRALYEGHPVDIANAMYDVLDTDGNYGKAVSSMYFKELYELEKSIDENVISMSPLLTEETIIGMNLKLDIPVDEHYYSLINKAIKEFEESDKSSTNIDKLVSLGWAPFVSLNEFTINASKKRCIENSMYNVVNLSKVYLEEYDPHIEQYNPVYFILGYPSTFEEFANRTHINKAAISFTPDLTTCYIINGMESNFTGFTRVSKDELLLDPGFKVTDIITIFVDEKSYIRIKDNCDGLTGNADIIPGFQSIYSIITKFKIPVAKEALRLLYSQFVDMIMRIASVDLSTKEVVLGDFMLSKANESNIYKIYSGELEKYNPDRTVNILSTICNNDNRLSFAESHSINESAKSYILNNISPNILIHSINDQN